MKISAQLLKDQDSGELLCSMSIPVLFNSIPNFLSFAPEERGMRISVQPLEIRMLVSAFA